ncbi:MAG: hypothetical protein ACQEWM_02625 [Actinomycetota bacterium]
MTPALALAAGELAALRGRRLGWAVVLAAVGSFLGGLAMAGLALALDDVAALETSTVVVSRGSSATVAVAVLASLAVAGPYRDGSWLHAALAEPSPARRMLAGAVPVIALGVRLGAIAVVAAAAGAAVVDPGTLAAVPLVAAAHLPAVGVWSAWMLCLGHATRSPLATAAVGAGLPLMIEPALAGALAQSALADVRWLLPATSLRSLAELPVGDGALLDGPPLALSPMLVAAALGWTVIAGLAGWLRARAAQPR